MHPHLGAGRNDQLSQGNVLLLKRAALGPGHRLCGIAARKLDVEAMALGRIDWEYLLFAVLEHDVPDGDPCVNVETSAHAVGAATQPAANRVPAFAGHHPGVSFGILIVPGEPTTTKGGPGMVSEAVPV